MYSNLAKDPLFIRFISFTLHYSQLYIIAAAANAGDYLNRFRILKANQFIQIAITPPEFMRIYHVFTPPALLV